MICDIKWSHLESSTPWLEPRRSWEWKVKGRRSKVKTTCLSNLAIKMNKALNVRNSCLRLRRQLSVRDLTFRHIKLKFTISQGQMTILRLILCGELLQIVSVQNLMCVCIYPWLWKCVPRRHAQWSVKGQRWYVKLSKYIFGLLLMYKSIFLQNLR